MGQITVDIKVVIEYESWNEDATLEKIKDYTEAIKLKTNELGGNGMKTVREGISVDIDR